MQSHNSKVEWNFFRPILEMNRQSVTPFTQVTESTSNASGVPPVQVPPAMHDDTFGGATQSISQTQVIDTTDNHHRPTEVCYHLLTLSFPHHSVAQWCTGPYSQPFHG